MKEIIGDLFNPPFYTDAICITTNGMIRSDGKAVMGRGIALAAKNKFLGIDVNLAQAIKQSGNHVNIIYNVGVFDKGYLIFSLPTKNDWRDKSDINLIIRSCAELQIVANKCDFKKIILPRPGCANGGLNWVDVKKAISFLDDRFYIVTRS
jgi:hypothetical protein